MVAGVFGDEGGLLSGVEGVFLARIDIVDYCHKKTKMDDDDKAEKEFNKFDSNGDGKISSNELGDALKTLGSVSPEEVKTMMDELDTDQDGYISYEEFTDFYNANRCLMKDLGKVF
ncbi:hypothetical protein L1987_18174 [Smallanthus sonchifolius]|uniref:Uncharacterized protein n=1 Tax=Smallanthus sonchifolius TaxID=185202 RepID=A0ACB9IZI8_9ASTR|nr:hypothetical protein L1987_18174 [Smallanthus sonchifolius]